MENPEKQKCYTSRRYISLLIVYSIFSVSTHSFSFMARKLYSLASGKCAPDPPDSPANQEVLLGGHLYLMVLKVCNSPVSFLLSISTGVCE